MGKMGAGELNYSSDVDLICLFDETRFSPDDYSDARASFIRAVRKMCQTLSERTAEGYVFRTDLRLRPDASVTPVAISMEAAERYYESFGRTWERAAFIKARICAGDVVGGDRFLKTLEPFVWRRHLDYAAIQDAHDMRLRIRDHKGIHGPVSHLGHDLKLGQGGIREIEFFTQTRQIIAGGRDADLRVKGTVDGLSVLAQKGWIDEDHAETLTVEYRFLREAEHRVQMIADHQTHLLPTTEAEFARLACLAGEDPQSYAEHLEATFARVTELTENFFQPDEPAKQERPKLSAQSEEIVGRWSGYPALRSPRAIEIFRRVSPDLLARFAKTSHPDEALSNFDGFLRGLPAGVQVFSLFEANPQLLDLLIDIVDIAPALGQYLARNSAVFDAVIGGDFFADWPGADELTMRLGKALAEHDDYEKKLDRAREWAREWHFRIGVHHLRGLIEARASGRQYAELADACISALWPVVIAQFSEKHGPPPGNGAVVVGMGSLGGQRLNTVSDLDLIVIYDGAGADSSEGRRPLATRPYYARLTQALVTAISAPTAAGRLYEVDMRLRPSGRQGPVATSIESFLAYQKEEAWTWEHLALTRARPIVGSDGLSEAVNAVREDILRMPRSRDKVLGDVADMRRRLADAKPTGGRFEVKTGPGRMQDIELLAQTGALLAGGLDRAVPAQLAAGADVLGLTEAEILQCQIAYRLYWRVQASLRLIFGEPGPGDHIGVAAAEILTRETQTNSLEKLENLIEETTRGMAELIDRIIGHAQDES